jgi:hypothetical protein
MKTHLNILKSLLLISLAISCKQAEIRPGEIHSFNLKSLVKNDSMALLSKSGVFIGNSLECSIREGKNQLILTDGSEQISWEKAKYLVMDVYHENNFSAILYIDFFKKTADDQAGAIVQQGQQAGQETSVKPRISSKIGILPKVKTRVIFPLSYLDGQNIFMDRFPRQLKGTVLGRRLELSDIGKVALRFEPVMAPDFLPKIEISAISLTDTIPPPLKNLSIPVVDEFGQWSARNWDGKTQSESDLKKNLHNLESLANNSSFPENWSIYGGWKDKKFKATGFFRTHNDGKRWWLVDPEGYAFLSAGVDCIRPRAEGLVAGQEDMFSWIPAENDSVFSDAFAKRKDETRMYDFVQSNLIRVYGKEWRNRWESITSGLLKEWSINTIANWSDISFARTAKVPYVLNMSRFPTTETLLYRDFPDVYSEEYSKNAVEFAKQLASFKNDQYLIGYFLSNEPHWAFGDNNIAFEMLATTSQSATKTEFTVWLQTKYNSDISTFNASWKQDLKSFSEIAALVLKETPSQACWNDCNEFSGIMVDQYVKLVCDEVKKVDANHLNLGMRYAWISSELCYRAGAYFDVFSINGYNYPGPPQTAEITWRSGKPVIIGEYHFGATDRGLPANGIVGAENQQARGESYRYYLEQGFSRPELIGIHYFQWMDQPVFGRFDGENYNIGFLDICMHPYIELTEQAKLSHERMYKVACGEEKPFDKIIRKVPAIYY